MWTPVPDGRPTPEFWARRYAFETAIHRADAALAVGAEFTVNQAVAIDAIDEWMELGSLPQIFEVHPGPLTSLLLVIYGRLPARSEGIEILGDPQLLDFWLERVSFG